MISSSKYVKWIRGQIETDLHSIGIGYNPAEKKRIIKQGFFDMENPITDISYFTKIFSRAANKYIGNEYKVRLINTKCSFIPKFFPQKSPDVLLMKKYLNKAAWNKKKYFGVFKIDDISEFFMIFLNYSVNYSYQDIILFPAEKDFVIQISHHGEIWLASPSIDSLKLIGNELDKEGATVIKGNTL
ncbi:MAG: hypothetical protein P4L45_14580 [Ignavibacteriaceae bacterium]|nr:hypothetical protein [Ignavibacteriaceae bacterium]